MNTTLNVLAMTFGIVLTSWGMARIVHFFYKAVEMISIAIVNHGKPAQINKGKTTFFLDALSVVFGIMTIVKFFNK